MGKASRWNNTGDGSIYKWSSYDFHRLGRQRRRYGLSYAIVTLCLKKLSAQAWYMKPLVHCYHQRGYYSVLSPYYQEIELLGPYLRNLHRSLIRDDRRDTSRGFSGTRFLLNHSALKSFQFLVMSTTRTSTKIASVT